MWWKQGKRRVGYAEQCAQLVELKAAYPWLAEVPSHALQQSLRDLDRAFANFFAGRARYPKFKRSGRGEAFREPDHNRITVDGHRVRLPKLGWCALGLSRPIGGEIRHATVAQEAGHWFVSFSVIEEMPDPVMPSGPAIGLDMGVASTLTVSDGRMFHVAGWTPRMRKRRLRLERSIARKKRHSANQRKARQRLARMHVRARRRRHDQVHKLTTVLAKSHGRIVVEDLNIAGMTRSAKGTMEEPGRNVRQKAGLNREILERSWGEINRQLTYKALWYGSDLVLVPAQYTSQGCRSCGHIAAENRQSQAVFRCVSCGHGDHADVNAARNILAPGLNEPALRHSVDACGAVA